MIRNIVACFHAMDTCIKQCQATFSLNFDIGLLYWFAIAGFGQLKGGDFGISYLPVRIDGDPVLRPEDVHLTCLFCGGCYFPGGNIHKGVLQGIVFNVAVFGPFRYSQCQLFSSSAPWDQPNTNLYQSNICFSNSLYPVCMECELTTTA